MSAGRTAAKRTPEFLREDVRYSAASSANATVMPSARL
jgi:hypothetical protein